MWALCKLHAAAELAVVCYVIRSCSSSSSEVSSISVLFKLLHNNCLQHTALLSTMGGDSAGLAQFDPYAILGIELGADSKDIKRAYRSLSLQYHPDKNPGNKMAEDMFMKIAKAYEALTDATVRALTATHTRAHVYVGIQADEHVW
jgi:DnaJ domain